MVSNKYNCGGIWRQPDAEGIYTYADSNFLFRKIATPEGSARNLFSAAIGRHDLFGIGLMEMPRNFQHPQRERRRQIPPQFSRATAREIFIIELLVRSVRFGGFPVFL